MRATHRVVANCQTVGVYDDFATAFVAFYRAFERAARRGMSPYHVQSFWIEVGGRIFTLDEVVALAHDRDLLTEDGQLVEADS